MIRYHHDSRQTPTGREIRLITDGQGQSIPVTHRVWMRVCERCQGIPWCRCGVPPVSNAPDYSLVDKEVRATWLREMARPPAPAPRPVLRLRRFADAAHEGVPPLPDVGAEVIKLQRQRGQRA